MGKEQFDLSKFELLPDGTYRKKKTVLQPREIAPKLITKKYKDGTTLSFVPYPPFDDIKYSMGYMLAGRVEVKPLSVNNAWRGRRYKTKDYEAYEKGVLGMLQKCELPEPPYKLSLVFGVSTRNADIDNPAKLFIDILQKKYKFNDKEIFELNIKKVIVAKRKEFCEFKMEHL